MATGHGPISGMIDFGIVLDVIFAGAALLLFHEYHLECIGCLHRDYNLPLRNVAELLSNNSKIMVFPVPYALHQSHLKCQIEFITLFDNSGVFLCYDSIEVSV